MRRTPSTPSIDDTAAVATAAGANVVAFDTAYRALVRARLAYDEVAGDPQRVSSIAVAAARLAAARTTMAQVRTAA